MNWVYLAAGGLLGTFTRFFVTKFSHRFWGLGFPVGTLAVNLLGCFLVGAYAGWELSRLSASNPMRMFFVTGFCGAFTTFSAFVLETSDLWYRGETGRSLLNVCLNFGFGVILFFAGFKIFEKGL